MPRARYLHIHVVTISHHLKKNKKIILLQFVNELKIYKFSESA